MIKALQQLFAMFGSLFLSGDNLAMAAVALSEVAKSAAEEQLEVSQIERAKRMAKLRGELRAVEAEAAAIAPSNIIEVKAA